MRKRWTPAEDELLLDFIEQHKPLAPLARRLGRTLEAVEHRWSSVLKPRYGGTPDLTLDAVARLFGFSHSVVVLRWVRAGALAARKGRTGDWVVTRAALRAFMADPAWWPRWEPSSVAEPGLRAWALEMRRGVRLLTMREAAPLLNAAPPTVWRWVREGRLPAYPPGQVCRKLREDEVLAFAERLRVAA